MDDERRRRELGSAPTTPDGTLEMPASDQVDSPSEPGPGAAISHFVVRARLGEGGMGVVLACVDADLGRPVALKLVRSDAQHPAYRDRLLREAQAMARLEHPNVVKVYEVGSDRGRLFIAMELVEGVTLGTWLHQQHRAWREVIDMFIQVGEGLAAVHGGGLVHRDFKPDNVLVDRTGRARVADFGLARIDDATARTLTRTGALMGTPGYMAPEQQFGADVDARADQYSFCVALREALGGRPLDDVRWANVPKQIRTAVMRGLSYEASERFASMRELVDALRAVTVPVSEPRWAVALLVLAVIGGIAGVVAVVTSRREERPRPQLAITKDAMPAVRELPDARDEAIASRGSAAARSTPAGSAESIVEAPPPPPPVDAAVATVKRAPRDASVATSADAAPQPALNIIAPTSKKLPEAQVGHPGHLPLVRAALKDLGYDGFDPKLKADALEDAIAAASGADRAVAQVKLGQLKRRAGDCQSATALWEKALEVIKNNDEATRDWAARAWMGRGLCALGAGKGDEAFELVSRAWLHGVRDEVSLAMAFASYEKGDKNTAYGMLLGIEHSSNPKVQAALKTWLDGMGFTLR